METDACGCSNRADRVRFDAHRFVNGHASGDWTMERSARSSMALHHLRRVLSWNARIGPTAVSIFWSADDRVSHAGMADRADRSGPELCGVRIAGLSRSSRSHPARTVGSFVPFGHGAAARFPAHYSAAGFSHRFTADDE